MHRTNSYNFLIHSCKNNARGYHSEFPPQITVCVTKLKRRNFAAGNERAARCRKGGLLRRENLRRFSLLNCLFDYFLGKEKVIREGCRKIVFKTSPRERRDAPTRYIALQYKKITHFSLTANNNYVKMLRNLLYKEMLLCVFWFFPTHTRTLIHVLM